MNLKALSLALALITVSGVAIADTVTTPASSSTTASKSTFDWTGVYVGGFMGGASSTNTTTSGPIIDGETVFPDKSYSYDTSASFIGGGTVGYNWQIGKTPFLVGLEGEYGYLDMSGSKAGPNNPAPEYLSVTHSTNVGGSYGYGLVGGRVGYALDKSLFYVKSGAVFTSSQTNFDFSIHDTMTVLDRVSGHSSSTSNSVGFAIGGGIEQALPTEWFTLANHITVKAEYLYLGINRTQNSIGNINFDGIPISSVSTSDSLSGIHTAKIGVNYKF